MALRLLDEVDASRNESTSAVREAVSVSSHKPFDVTQEVREGTYDVFAREDWMRRANSQLILRLPDVHESEPVIYDVGCGTGESTRLLLDRYPHASFVCLDQSDDMLQVAREKFQGQKRVQYVLGDASDLKNLSAKKPAMITAFNMIHYLPTDADRSNFIKSAEEALPSGGTFAFNTGFFDGAKTPGTQLFYGSLASRIWDELTKKFGVPDPKYKRGLKRKDASVQTYQSMLNASGFDIPHCQVDEEPMNIGSIREFFRTKEVADSIFPDLPFELGREILGNAIDAATLNIDNNVIFPRRWLYVMAKKK